MSQFCLCRSGVRSLARGTSGRVECLVVLAVAVGLALGGCPCLTSTGDPNDPNQAAQGAPGPVGPAGSVGPEGPAGKDGATGPAGADGQLRIYGDGSAGDVTIDSDGELFTLLPDRNLQCGDFTVETGVTLTVPSGTAIRCTGTFTNKGTVVVRTGEHSGGTGALGGAGVAHRPAGNSIVGTDAFFTAGAAGGMGLTEDEAALFLQITASAGGAGGGKFPGGLTNAGGSGGGELVVLARAAIINGGGASILADGEDSENVGAGGGAGGIVILASPGSVTNAGLVSVRGGVGADAQGVTNDGAAGGGGGGIVHLLAPVIDTSAGTVDTSGGAGGAEGVGSNGTRYSGAGGGACGGRGGAGGEISNAPGNVLYAAQPGLPGYSFETLVDPTALF